jgi:glycosyltransferase involved in cell wall biosynthesis
MLKISIIIPHFNNSKYIDVCLKSIFKQTYKNYEIIIVDDCSMEEEKKIAMRLAGNYGCMFLKNEINLGVSETRNKGLCKASGDILTTIDPDDYYVDHNYLDDVVSYFVKENNCVVGTKAIYVNQEGNLLTKKISKKIINGWVKECFFARTCYIPINIFYTKEMFHKTGGYNIKYRVYEDWDFKLKLANSYKFIIKDVEIAYRIHDHGLSTLGRLDKVFSLIYVFINNIHLLKATEAFKIIYLFGKSVPYKFKSIISAKKF